MPPRLNKRQLREQEELHALQEGADEAHSDSAEEEIISPGPVPGSTPLAGGFAALMDAEDDDESEEEGAAQSRSTKSKKKNQKKKKKKKPTSAPQPVSSPMPQARLSELEPVSTGASTSAGSSKKDKKALKKQKAKKSDDVDDLDKALAELSVKYPDLKQQLAASSSTSSTATARSLATLLSVSLAHLDGEAELRKFFGSKVISSVKGSSSSASARQSAAHRSNLTRPQSTWPPAQFRDGLSMRLLTPEEVEEGLRRHLWQPLHEEKIWTVDYSKKYRAVTFDFMRTVLSGNPDGFWMIIRETPYHVDTLLQLSEVYHHREEHSTAADFVDRALFAYERAFVGAFNFTSGTNRLDFDHVENRPFFLALHRQITDLQRRGCIRTSFEFARLLYALDPWTDPHGSLLHLDYLAIKAGMTKWLLDLWDLFASELEKESNSQTQTPYLRRLTPNILPGITYSRALALFITEEESHDQVHEQSTRALEHAISIFPSVVPLLADKADISLGGDVRKHPAFRIHTDNSWLVSDSQSILHLLSHLYAQRTFSFWKLPGRAAWFTKAVSTVLPSLPTSSPAPPRTFSGHFDSPLAHSIYRHVLVNEATCRNLFPFVPRAILDARHLACDPLPPSTRANEYDAEFFRGVEETRSAARPRSQRQEARLLEQLVPDAAFRGQLVGFYDAHPAVQQRFPGGVVQFVQWAGQMPEDALEDLFFAMADIGQLRQNREGEMPGGMPGGDVMVNFVDPEDLEDVPQVARPAENEVAHPLPVGQAHDGGEDDVEEEDEDEDEDEEEQEMEIAALPVRILRSVFNRFWGGSADAADDESDEEGAQGEQLRDTGGVD